MQNPPALHVMDWVGPAIGAVAFVLIMSFVREPARRRFNAVLVAGASGTYLSGGGFGVWELLYPALTTPVVYLALDSHRFIGIAWLMHSAWDLAHHWWGNPLWPFMATSSFGCLIFDALIATWFLAGAPTIPVAAALARAATGTSAADTPAARARRGTG
jgi:hypothetical protein